MTDRFKNYSREVTFITPNGDMEIRLTANDTAAMCVAADALKARYFVAADGFSEAENCPIWGVFDMRTAQKDTPWQGCWSINDPTRTFTTPTADAAVMFALAQGRS